VDEAEWQERSAASPDGNGRVVLVDTDVWPGIATATGCA
jgi:hypothetical protein